MKDYEILLWLMNLTPESEEQRKAIESAERAFRNATGNDFSDVGVEDFLQLYDRDTIINVSSGELYDEYFNYCEDFDYTPVSQIMLTKLVQKKFNVKCRPVFLNNKTVRIYK